MPFAIFQRKNSISLTDGSFCEKSLRILSSNVPKMTAATVLSKNHCRVPNPVEASAVLYPVANIAMFKDVDRTIYEFVFSKRLLGMQEPK